MVMSEWKCVLQYRTIPIMIDSLTLICFIVCITLALIKIEIDSIDRPNRYYYNRV